MSSAASPAALANVLSSELGPLQARLALFLYNDDLGLDLTLTDFDDDKNLSDMNELFAALCENNLRLNPFG